MPQALHALAFDLFGLGRRAGTEPSQAFSTAEDDLAIVGRQKTDLELEREEVSEIAFATFGFYPVL